MTDYTEQRIDWLLAEIAELESQMEDTELSASEQEQLLKDWKNFQGELEELMEKKEREELMSDPNNWEDNREDCSRCSGCAYCMETSAYDGADEI
jgi:CCR4-NOT transcriptional regulation complex NOT5 subunit